MKQRIKNFALVLISVFVTLSASAQVTTSSMSGIITESDGTPLVGATAVAVHVPSGTQYAAMANEDGRYTILGMRPGGPYKVTFTFIGSNGKSFDGISLPLGETYSQNASLDTSVTLDEVVVSADGSQSAMNIKRSGTVTNISSDQVEMMPTVSRSINDVLRLTPQTSNIGSGISIGGGNYRQSYVTVDGASFNNSFGIGGNLPAGGSPISLDALEMLSVAVTPFDVRQSGFTGGSVNAVTKSGTNELKVSIYDYFTSDGLQGLRLRDREQLELSRSLENTVGVSVGAPIVKDKLFVFANFEYEKNITPGTSRLARLSDSDDYGSGTLYNRPTLDKMNEISNYLQDTYGYNPGRFQDYSISIPSWKLLARLDWNISDNHSFNFRYSKTTNKYSSSPSGSTSPLYNPYKPYGQGLGRTSVESLYFESNRYYQEQNFSSFAGELNSRFMNGKLNNTLRATYSRQYEPRSFEGGYFPTVDILEDGNVFTSFGPDPFTFGNLRDVTTFVVTDELSYVAGKHNLLAGLQYESTAAVNGFMPGGAGYYVFESWNDFTTNQKPVAFAMTHPNNSAMTQKNAELTYRQASLYLQDEINVSDRFKASVGVRFELPFFPGLENNENAELTALFASHGGYKTSDVPKAKFNVSPRIGFNYDLTGERKFIVRGGTGIFTGRLPMVWLVSAVGNSNCSQYQAIMYNKHHANDATMPSFAPNYNDVISNLHPGGFNAGELGAPLSATILDKELAMPMTWKSSLAFEANLPGGVKFNVEGIYNRDLRSVTFRKLGLDYENVDSVQLPGEPAARTKWNSLRLKSTDPNLSYGNVEPLYITNSDINGHYFSLTTQASKDFDFGLSLNAAYTYSTAKNIIDGIGDQVSSAFKTGTYNINGSNVDELGYASYLAPHRFIAGATYRTKSKSPFSIGVFYEGMNHGYLGGYSYARYSYTMGNSYTGESGAYNLMYVPTQSELGNMNFVSDENKQDFNNFINSDKYLSEIRGEYSERGGAKMPWRNTFDLKLEKQFGVKIANKLNSLSIGLDVQNVGNLVNRNWGSYEFISHSDILDYDSKTSTYEFNSPDKGYRVSTASAWSALVNIRYTFN